MGKLDLADFIIGCLTLLVAVVSAILTYKLKSQKVRLAKLEKEYSICIDNLEACYFLEKEYYAEKLEMSHRELQNDVKGFLDSENVKLYRDNFRPSYFEKQRLYLK